MLLFSAIALAAPPCDIDQRSPSMDPREGVTTGQLTPIPGTDRFRLRYCGIVQTSDGAGLTVQVGLTPDYPGMVGATEAVTTGAPFTLDGEVASGSWTVTSTPVETPDAERYWDAFAIMLFVDPDGRFTCTGNCTFGAWHSRKATLVAPAWREVVDEARPTLRWEPVQGATRATLQWFEHGWPTGGVQREGRVDVTGKSSWTFPEPLSPGRRLEWSVRFDSGDSMHGLARNNRSFFTHGTDPEATRRSVVSPVRIGVMPGVGWPALAERGVQPDEVYVRSVLPASPALAAGFEPFDVILSVGGTPIRTVSDLVDAVGAHEPGAKVPVEIRRAGETRTLHPVVEARPTDPAGAHD